MEVAWLRGESSGSSENVQYAAGGISAVRLRQFGPFGQLGPFIFILIFVQEGPRHRGKED